MREVHVTASWTSHHTLEVPDDHPKIGSGDLAEAIDASGEDIMSNVAELVDWEVRDGGPEA